MALQKNVTVISDEGTSQVLQNCYIKVSSISGDKESMVATVVTMVSDQSMVVSKSKYVFATQLDVSNFIAQAYEHLKTLPEFSGAIDV